MTLSIMEILQGPKKIGELKAGKNGVNRIVQSITVMDAPDIINWVRSNQLLLTTGYVIKDDITAQKKLITQLAERNCAGIAIKTKRFLMEIHPGVTELADRLDFPIIELSVDSHFADVISIILGKTMYPQNDNLQHTLNVYHQLTQLIMNGSDFSAVANKLEDWLHYGILFLDHKTSVIAYSNRIQKKYASIIPHIQQYVSKISVNDTTLHTNHIVINDHPLRIITYPVYIRNATRSFIILTETPEHMPEHYLTILEQVSTLFTFEQMKNEVIVENERKRQLEFFSSCLEKDSLSKDDILLGKAHGLIEAAYTCIIVRLSNEATGKELRNLWNDQIEQHILPTFPNTIVIHMLNDYILLIPNPQNSSQNKKNQIETQLESCLVKLALWLEKVQSLPFKLGVGGRSPLLADLPKSFREAQEALETGYQSKIVPQIRFYKSQEIVELLRYIPQNKIEEIYANTLGKFHVLKGHDREETLQTLFVYLENYCNVAETSKQLYVHRNTVLYRIEKCEELLDYSLKDPEKNLLLRIILRASQLFTLSQ